MHSAQAVLLAAPAADNSGWGAFERKASAKEGFTEPTYAAVQRRLLACLAAIAMVEAPAVTDTLEPVLAALEPEGSMEDAAAGDDPANLPIAWVALA